MIHAFAPIPLADKAALLIWCVLSGVGLVLGALNEYDTPGRAGRAWRRAFGALVALVLVFAALVLLSPTT